MKKALKISLLAILSVVFILLLWYHQLVIYGLSQAYGQIKIILLAKPVEEYLSQKDYPKAKKDKLKLIQEIRKFAFDSLGINYSDNYTTMYDLQGETPMWMLTACESFSFKPKEWDFPILGSFSYKGFFDSSMAMKEEEVLKKQHFDTDIGEISGWSTLGWFKDPILSNMLDRSEGSLANLIIHELTHGTLYVKNNVEYNENLASFVGDVGALKFLNYKYGPNSAQALHYQKNKEDYEKYTDHVLRGTQKLDSLYNTMAANDNIAQKEILKEVLIKKVMASMDTIGFFNKKFWYDRDDILPNNTFFMHYVRYRKQQNTFEAEFKNKFNSNFKEYFIYLKKTYPSL